MPDDREIARHGGGARCAGRQGQGLRRLGSPRHQTRPGLASLVQAGGDAAGTPTAAMDAESLGTSLEAAATTSAASWERAAQRAAEAQERAAQRAAEAQERAAELAADAAERAAANSGGCTPAPL